VGYSDEDLVGRVEERGGGGQFSAFDEVGGLVWDQL
jgi:hypothetical protein